MNSNESILDDSDMQWVDSQVYYLRMERRPEPQLACDSHLQVQRLARPVDVGYYLELYQRVGLAHHWVDRLVIPLCELDALLNRDEVEIWVFLHDEQPCGYVELVRGSDQVEILYFGLFPEFAGRGLGTSFLRRAVELAWSSEPQWVELNTCDLDSDRALEVYQRVGFEVYTTRMEKRRSMS
ncbi:MAG: GNAT family N-acetyltransferase [Puniceicoccaceae bacterium]